MNSSKCMYVCVSGAFPARMQTTCYDLHTLMQTTCYDFHSLQPRCSDFCVLSLINSCAHMRFWRGCNSTRQCHREQAVISRHLKVMLSHHAFQHPGCTASGTILKQTLSSPSGLMHSISQHPIVSPLHQCGELAGIPQSLCRSGVSEHTLYALMLIDSLHVQVEPALTTCAGMR